MKSLEMKSFTWLTFAMAGALVLPGCAGSGAVKPVNGGGTTVQSARGSAMFVPADMDTAADFTRMAATIRQGLQPGGRWALATPQEKDAINDKLGVMQGAFDQFGSVARMDQRTRLQLFNDQEAINAILSRREDQRIVCRQTTITGSLLPYTECMTQGQRRRQAEATGAAYQQLKSTLDQTPDHKPLTGTKP